MPNRKAQWHKLQPGAYSLTEAAALLGISRTALRVHYCCLGFTGEARFALPPHVEAVWDMGEVKFLRVATPSRQWKRQHSPKRREGSNPTSRSKSEASPKWNPAKVSNRKMPVLPQTKQR